MAATHNASPGTEARPKDPYSPTLDSTGVRPLGAYAARRCPVQTQLRFDPPAGVGVALPGVTQQRRIDNGDKFESTVTDAFERAVRVAGTSDEVVVANTVHAMQSGAQIIVGGRIPDDLAGHRTGRPHVLVRAGSELSDGGKPAYWPIDVKNHGTTGVTRGLPARLSPIEAPFVETAVLVEGRFDVNGESRRNDLLQLAHYWRMLEACGHAASGSGPVWGGIVGTDQAGVVWADLNAPRFRSNGDINRDATESALRRYDFEFALRLDIAKTAILHRTDPTVALLTDPMKCADCASCEWRDHCLPALNEGAGDVSLLPRVGHRQWSALRRLGFQSRGDVAAIDVATARLVDAFPVDLSISETLEAALRHEPTTPLKGVLGRKAVRQLRTFDDCGLATAGDLTALDNRVLALHGTTSNLVELVDIAWIAVHGGGQPHRRRSVDSTVISRADVEIDIDMECDFQGGTYLWGTLLTNRSGIEITRTVGYRPFVGWNAVTPTSEAVVFEDFWEWLLGVISELRQSGLTVRIYSWHDAAEIGKMRRAAALTDSPETRTSEIRALVADPTTWVDLEREFNTVAVGAEGSGLKVVAPFAGAHWNEDGAGGDISMVWHEEAVQGDIAARARLLRYNEDDVRACLAIREWLCADGLPTLPA